MTCVQFVSSSKITPPYLVVGQGELHHHLLADAAAHQVPVLDLVLDVPGDVVAGQDQGGRQDEDGDEC